MSRLGEGPLAVEGAKGTSSGTEALGLWVGGGRSHLVILRLEWVTKSKNGAYRRGVVASCDPGNLVKNWNLRIRIKIVRGTR